MSNAAAPSGPAGNASVPPTLETVRARETSSGSAPTSPQAAVTRDLAAARAAFESGSIEESRRAHARVGAGSPGNAEKSTSAEASGEGGKSPMPAVEAGHDLADSSSARGALHAVYDGALTVSCFLAAATSLGLPGVIVVALAGSLSLCLALGRTLKEWRLRTIAIAHWDRERARESWELEHFESGERREMIELYAAKGLSVENAAIAVNALATHHGFFVDLMMSQELEMVEPERPALPIAVLAGASYLAGSLVVLVLAITGHLTLQILIGALATPSNAGGTALLFFPQLVSLVSKVLPLAWVPFSHAAEVAFSGHLVFLVQRFASSDAAASAFKLLPLLTSSSLSAGSSAAAPNPADVYAHRAGIIVLSSLLTGFLLLLWVGIAYLLRAAGDQLPSLQARRGQPRGAHARIFATQIAVCALLCATLTTWVFTPLLALATDNLAAIKP